MTDGRLRRRTAAGRERIKINQRYKTVTNGEGGVTHGAENIQNVDNTARKRNTKLHFVKLLHKHARMAVTVGYTDVRFVK